MFGVSRGRIVSAIITTAVLTGLVAGCILFVSQQQRLRATHLSAQARASTSPTAGGVTSQFTPAPGITVTVSATPSHRSSSSSTTSYTGGANGATGATYPPASTSTTNAGSGPSGSGISATPTTSPATTPTATPATPYDDATLISYSPTTLNAYTYTWTQVSVTLLNSGTTTWDSSRGYGLECHQNCWSWNVSYTSFVVAPGQSHTFIGNMLPLPSSFYYRVDDSVWGLYGPAGAIGQAAVITVVEHGWDQSTVLTESAPSCLSDGSVWSFQGSPGTASCGSSSLALAQGGPGGVTMALISTPSGYSYTRYYVTFHVHFNTSSATTFAGVVLSMPSTASGGHQTEFMVSPAGYYCETQTISYCVPGGAIFPIPASSDYDFIVDVYSSLSFSVGVNGPYGTEGGFIGGGPTGLIEMTASGSTDVAYFSNYQLYKFK